MKKLPEIIYMEFLIPIMDYLFSQDWRERVFDFLLPLIGAGLMYYLFLGQKQVDIGPLSYVISYVINLLAILIGFTITCVTILTSSSSKTIEQLKKHPSGRKSRNQDLSLYHLILISFSHVLLVEIFTLGLCLIYSIIVSVNRAVGYGNWFLAFTTLMLLHVLVLNIRNITNLYFVLWRVSDESG